MVLVILMLLFSCSWAFGYALEHGLSLLYPTIYLMGVLVGMAMPAICQFISVRRR